MLSVAAAGRQAPRSRNDRSTTVKRSPYLAGHHATACPRRLPPLMDVSTNARLVNPGLVPPLHRRASASTHQWVVVGHVPAAADALLFCCVFLPEIAPCVTIKAAYPGTCRVGARTRNTGLWFVLVTIEDATFLQEHVAGRVVCHVIDGQAATDLTYRHFDSAAAAAAYTNPKSSGASYARNVGQRRLPPVTIEHPNGPIPQYVIDEQAARDRLLRLNTVAG